MEQAPSKAKQVLDLHNPNSASTGVTRMREFQCTMQSFRLGLTNTVKLKITL
jgi:hypothetical protein